jgi:hypothetical protein
MLLNRQRPVSGREKDVDCGPELEFAKDMPALAADGRAYEIPTPAEAQQMSLMNQARIQGQGDTLAGGSETTTAGLTVPDLQGIGSSADASHISTTVDIPAEEAWSAMTQLWHDSGDFVFDEAVLGAVHDERAESSVGGFEGAGNDGKDSQFTMLWDEGFLWNQLA